MSGGFWERRLSLPVSSMLTLFDSSLEQPENMVLAFLDCASKCPENMLLHLKG